MPLSASVTNFILITPVGETVISLNRHYYAIYQDLSMWGRTRQSLKRGIWKQKRLSQEKCQEIDISFFGCSDLSLPQFSVRILIVYSHFHVDVSLPLGTQPVKYLLFKIVLDSIPFLLDGTTTSTHSLYTAFELFQSPPSLFPYKTLLFLFSIITLE